MTKRCTRKGCRAFAVHGSKLCFAHAPSLARKRHAARRRGGLTRARALDQPRLEPFDLSTRAAAGVALGLLINELRAAAIDVARAYAITFALRLLLQEVLHDAGAVLAELTVIEAGGATWDEAEGREPHQVQPQQLALAAGAEPEPPAPTTLVEPWIAAAWRAEHAREESSLLAGHRTAGPDSPPAAWFVRRVRDAHQRAERDGTACASGCPHPAHGGEPRETQAAKQRIARRTLSDDLGN